MSEMTTYNPVVFTHASGHGCFANDKEIELAGITKITTDPKGGKIVIDKCVITIIGGKIIYNSSN